MSVLSGPSADDDGMEDIERERALYELVDAEFGWVTVDEALVACQSPVDDFSRKHLVDKWTFWVMSDAGPLYPKFVFTPSSYDADCCVVADVPESALYWQQYANPDASVWDVIEWMLTPNPRLGGGRPVDLKAEDCPRSPWSHMRLLAGLDHLRVESWQIRSA